MRHLKIVKWVFVPVFFLGIIAAAVVNFYNADYAKNALDFFRALFRRAKRGGGCCKIRTETSFQH